MITSQTTPLNESPWCGTHFESLAMEMPKQSNREMQQVIGFTKFMFIYKMRYILNLVLIASMF